MNAAMLQKALIDSTVALCGHEERKGEVHMSWLADPIETILSKVRNGHDVDELTRLKFFHGTWAEAGLRHRLDGIRGHSGVSDCNVSIQAYDGRLIGHVDIVLPDNEMVEYKTVPTIAILDDVKKKGRVPFRVFSQVQAYLLWGKFKKAFVVYESREGGYPWVTEMLPHYNRQKELVEIAEKVLAQI